MPRILLIEDEDELRHAIRAMLVHLGHVVDEAPNGRVGVEKFHAVAPDIVITDILMPVMEGIETIRLIKRARPDARIIAMSGGGNAPASSYLRLAQHLGAAHVLAKPFSCEELEAEIAAVLAIQTRGDARTFLVLDDNATSRLLNRCLLEAEFPQSRVIECGSVAEALEASRGQQLDAVVTDHHLGESDGGEFIQRLRALGAACPIVMVTGNSDPKVHARAYAAGASHVFFDQENAFIDYLRSKLDDRRPPPSAR